METQQDFLDQARLGKNIDLSGYAGTGKSYIVKQYIEESENKGYTVVRVAPTGIAAMNIGGSTIHKTFKLNGNNYYKKGIQEIDWNYVDIIIFDEDSMINGLMFQYCHDILKDNCKGHLPWGGKQIICIGDNAQLPPIFNMKDPLAVKQYEYLVNNFGGITFDKSSAYKDGNFIKINLTEYQRSHDSHFNSLLFQLRDGDNSVLKQFKSEGYSSQFYNKATHIFATNNEVDSLNYERLLKLPGKQFVFKGIIKGDFNMDNVLVPEELKLKVGARIMIVKNLGCGLVNGDTGEVTSIDINNMSIKIMSDRFEKEFDIGLETWDNIVYDEHGNQEKKGSLKQFPMKLGWAITAHKCLDGNQLIKGTQGRFKISNGQIGDKVYTANGIYSIIGKQYMGKKDTIKITTRTGLELISTKDHRILTAIDSNEEYIEAGKLSIGNKLIINRDIREGGKDIEIPIAELSSWSKLVNYPRCINKDFSYYIGLLIGDGSYNYKKDGRLDIESQDIEITNFLKEFYNKLNINLLIRDKKNYKSKTHIVTSRNLRDTLFNIGLSYVTGKDKVIPECFNEMDINNRGQLLSGLFDTDGSFSKTRGNIIFTSTSNKLIKQIQLMLLDMGIISFIYKMKVYSNKHNQSYQLHISGNNIILFEKYIGFKIGYKKKLLNDYINSGKLKGKTNVDFIINSKEIKNEFKELCKSNFINGSINSKGTGYSHDERISSILYMKKLSYSHLEYLNNFAINKGINLPILNKTLEHNYYYDEIISIEANGKTDVYDLEIDTEHSFVAQGIVVHNCQGLTLDKMIYHHRRFCSKELVYTAISRGTSYDNTYVVYN